MSPESLAPVLNVWTMPRPWSSEEMLWLRRSPACMDSSYPVTSWRYSFRATWRRPMPFECSPIHTHRLHDLHIFVFCIVQFNKKSALVFKSCTEAGTCTIALSSSADGTTRPVICARLCIWIRAGSICWARFRWEPTWWTKWVKPVAATYRRSLQHGFVWSCHMKNGNLDSWIGFSKMSKVLFVPFRISQGSVHYHGLSLFQSGQGQYLWQHAGFLTCSITRVSRVVLHKHFKFR